MVGLQVMARIIGLAGRFLGNSRGHEWFTMPLAICSFPSMKWLGLITILLIFALLANRFTIFGRIIIASTLTFLVPLSLRPYHLRLR